MTETVYSAKNGSLNKQRSLIYASLSQRRDMAQPVPIKAFLQSAKVAAMCTAPRAETSPPPPIPTFFASTKPISHVAQNDIWRGELGTTCIR